MISVPGQSPGTDGSRMATSRPRRASRWLAHASLLVLAGCAGTVLGQPATTGPRSEAAVLAEQAAAGRIRSSLTMFPLEERSSSRYALLEGFDSVAAPSMATRVHIPSVGLDAEVRPVGIVFRDGHLQYDVPTVEAGQYAGARPGEVGNTVIGGHVSTRAGGGVFRALPTVTVGAPIEVYRGAERHQYQVTEVRIVASDATEVMEQTQDATLTLITCSDDRAHAKRVVVVAKLV
jgi:LPXTG-site transpeptidase (sortase) family protein